MRSFVISKGFVSTWSEKDSGLTFVFNSEGKLVEHESVRLSTGPFREFVRNVHEAKKKVYQQKEVKTKVPTY